MLATMGATSGGDVHRLRDHRLSPARACGWPAFSLVTNRAAGLGEPLSHEEVTDVGRAAATERGRVPDPLRPPGRRGRRGRRHDHPGRAGGAASTTPCSPRRPPPAEVSRAVRRGGRARGRRGVRVAVPGRGRRHADVPASRVAVCAVIGFPSGAHRPEVKAAEADLARGRRGRRARHGGRPRRGQGRTTGPAWPPTSARCGRATDRRAQGDRRVGRARARRARRRSRASPSMRGPTS